MQRVISLAVAFVVALGLFSAVSIDDVREAEALTQVAVSGNTGSFSISDSKNSPSAFCDIYYDGFTYTVWGTGPKVKRSSAWAAASPGLPQAVKFRAELVQRVDGSVKYIASSPETQIFAPANGAWSGVFPVYEFAGYEMGPEFAVRGVLTWTKLNGSADGIIIFGLDWYKTFRHESPGVIKTQVVSSACKPVAFPDVTANSFSLKVNQSMQYIARYFPYGVPVDVYFDGKKMQTVITNDDGRAIGTLKIPAATIGSHTVTWRYGSDEDYEESEEVTIKPSISFTPSTGERGSSVSVTIRGFAAGETVKIKWKRDGSYKTMATVNTNILGTAKVDIIVPAWAPDGAAEIRADGPIGKSKSTAYVVSGGVYEAEEGQAKKASKPADAKPEPSASPSPEATATPDATATAEATAPATEVATESPAEPTADSTPDPAATPEPEATAEPSATPEPAVDPDATQESAEQP